MNTEFTTLLSNPELSAALEARDHIALAKHLGKTMCGFTDDDLVRMNMFWDGKRSRIGRPPVACGLKD